MTGQSINHPSPRLAALAMEMCVLYPALGLIRKALGWDTATFLAILACYPSAFLLKSALPRLAHAVGKKRGAAVAAIVFVLGVGTALSMQLGLIEKLQISRGDFPGQLVSIGLGLLLCLWGASVMAHKTDHKHIQLRFQIAALAMLLVLLFGGRQIAPILLFFIFAMAALASSRWIDSATAGAGVLQPQRRGSFIIAALWILVPSVFLLIVLSPESARAILEILSRGGTAIVRWLDRMPAPKPGGKMPEIRIFSGCATRPPGDAAFLRNVERPHAATGTTSDEMLIAAAVLAIGIMSGVLLFLLIRSLKKKRGLQPVSKAAYDAISLEISVLGRIKAVFEKIIDFLRRLAGFLVNRTGGLFRRRKSTAAPLSEPKALYREMLQWSSRVGSPRSQCQTPYELLSTLTNRFPDSRRDLTLITEVFIQDRYGRLPPERNQFEHAVKAWQRIQAC